MGVIGKVNLRPPTGSKIQNPLTNGSKVRKVREAHRKNYAKTGLKPLRSPLR